VRKLRVRNDRLAAAMAKRGLTNLRLALLCGLHPMSISALLNLRRDPTPETAKLIAQTLGVSTTELFSSEKDKEVSHA